MEYISLEEELKIRNSVGDKILIIATPLDIEDFIPDGDDEEKE